GDDAVAVRGTAAATTVITGDGKNAVTVGDAGLVKIQGRVDVRGNGDDTLTVDAAAATALPAGTLSADAVTGLGATGGGIGYAGVRTLNLRLGGGADTLTVAGTSPAVATTTIDAGDGADTIDVRGTASNLTVNAGAGDDTIGATASGADASLTINSGPGANAVLLGRLSGDAAGTGSTLKLVGPVVVFGGGADAVTVDNGGSPLAATGTLSPTAVTGLGTAGITYGGAAGVAVLLGTGGGTFTVLDTAAGVISRMTGGGGGTIAVRGTTGPLAVDAKAGDAVVLGSTAPTAGGTLAGLKGPVAIAGDGSAKLTIDARGDAAARTVTVGSAAFGASGSAAVGYTGLATLDVLLGSGGNAVTVTGTPAGTATTLDTGGGNDVVVVQATAGPLALRTGDGTNKTTVGTSLAAVAGKVTVTGNGSDALTLDDSANASPAAGTLTATGLSGFGTGGIDYAGVKTVTLNLGSAGDTLAVASTAAATATTVNANGGNDTSTIASLAGTATVNTGAGDDAVNVRSTAAELAVDTGTGNDVVTVGGAAAGGTTAGVTKALTVAGNGSAALVLDDSGNASPVAVTVTATAVRGLTGGAVNYAGLKSLTLNLGGGADAATVTATAAGTSTAVNAGGGDDAIAVAAPGGIATVLAGPVTVDGGAGANTLLVDDAGDKVARTVALSPTAITGLGAAVGYANLAALTLKLGSGNDALAVSGTNPLTATTLDGGAGTDTLGLTIAGDFAGTVAPPGFEKAAVSVTGDFSGSLVATALTMVTIGGSLTGSITAGSLGTLTVAGATPGTVSATTIGTITAKAATAGAGGVLLSVRQGGVLRQVKAVDAAGAPVTGVTFAYAYDGAASAAAPQVAVRVANAAPAANRFDLYLTAEGTKPKFNLSRLDSKAGASGVRSVIVAGDLLSGVTAAQRAFFGDAAGAPGGVRLASDNLVAVAVSGDARSGTVLAGSVQAVSFGSLTSASGVKLWTPGSTNAVQSILATNPATGKATKMAPATAVVTVLVGESNKVGLFVDRNADGTLNATNERAAATFADQAADNTAVLAWLTFKPAAGTSPLSLQRIDFRGDGAAVDTTMSVNTITGTGSLGDLMLRAGTGVADVTAASVAGNVDLFGGKISGTFQTTGLRTDPATGAVSTVSADVGRAITSSTTGAITGVTTFKAGIAATGRLVSRGTLFSQVTVSGPIDGLIAAAGDIGTYRRAANGTALVDSGGRLTRYGGITVATTIGTSGGQMLALGNVYGDLSVANTFTGRIAVQGSVVPGLAVTRRGVLGNLTLGTVGAAGAVISGGSVGDAAGGTAISVKALQGFVASKGAVAAKAGTTLPAGRVFANSVGGNAAVIDAVWTDGGLPLRFDRSAGDLAGLALIQADAQAIAASGSTLGGTSA
ncbi:MAG TPA: hypothetical protein VF796_05190, partial [Humisphaera sp.]